MGTPAFVGGPTSEMVQSQLRGSNDLATDGSRDAEKKFDSCGIIETSRGQSSFGGKVAEAGLEQGDDRGGRERLLRTIVGQRRLSSSCSGRMRCHEKRSSSEIGPNGGSPGGKVGKGIWKGSAGGGKGDIFLIVYNKGEYIRKIRPGP